MSYAMAIVNFIASFFKGKNFWFYLFLFLFFGSYTAIFIANANLSKKLEDSLKDSYIASLEKSICEDKLKKQNKLLEKIKKEVKIKPIKQKVKTKYKYIKVKDKTCEGELNAYKELFSAFGR